MVLFLLGLLGCFRVTQSSRFDSYRAIDVAQMISAGACLGAGVMGLVLTCLRPRR